MREARPTHDSLAAACEKLLVSCARANEGGTRQQVRAAARRFVRRHHRDAGYLAWVLRSTGACSALAVVLLGLTAAPATAELVHFAPFFSQFEYIDHPGYLPAPALGDLDADGDLDLVAGEFSGIFVYYENTGSAASAAFVAVSEPANPFAGLTTGTRSQPALADLDGDGDLDLVSGEQYGALHYYENTGSASEPAFAARTGVANPFEGFDVGSYSHPALGDLDGDGDLDLVSGAFDGTFSFFENSGSATAPVFGAASPLPAESLYYATTPALGDLDRDGDLDLIAGESGGRLLFAFENTGSATTASFVRVTDDVTPFVDYNIDPYASASLGDLDGDGDLDLVAGDDSGRLKSFEHSGGRAPSAVSSPEPLYPAQDVGSRSKPALGDLDGDGDRDLVVGAGTGTLFYFENTGGAADPLFIARTGSSNPVDGYDLDLWSAPAFGDLDGDGDLDLVAGNRSGGFFYFENTGDAVTPLFAAPLASPFGLGDVGSDSTPTLGDLDGDGDLDLVAGDGSGGFSYFENTGDAVTPLFAAPLAGPFGLGDLGSDSTPTLGDLDGDGDQDLVAGNHLSRLHYYENTGNATQPAFAARTGGSNPMAFVGGLDRLTPTVGDLDGDGDLDLVVGIYDGRLFTVASFIPQTLPSIELTGGANPLDGSDLGDLSVPGLGDLDGDGDLDLVAGEDQGGLDYFENTGSATTPAFTQRTGVANPLHGMGSPGHSAPALADLDGDGDLDLIVGERFGTFLFYENTGTATSAAFAMVMGAANPLDGLDVGYDSAPTFGDLDGDGDLDLLAGERDGSFLYFENTGGATSPALSGVTGASHPLDGQDLGDYSTGALGDFDGDGDLDFIAGEQTGQLAYYKNQGGAMSPAFVRLTGAANPLHAAAVAAGSAPAAGDLDRDGDLDLVTGATDGTFQVHYLPEPARGLLLGAGIALLGVFDRLRRRSPR